MNGIGSHSGPYSIDRIQEYRVSSDVYSHEAELYRRSSDVSSLYDVEKTPRSGQINKYAKSPACRRRLTFERETNTPDSNYERYLIRGIVGERNTGWKQDGHTGRQQQSPTDSNDVDISSYIKSKTLESGGGPRSKYRMEIWNDSGSDEFPPRWRLEPMSDEDDDREIGVIVNEGGGGGNEEDDIEWDRVSPDSGSCLSDYLDDFPDGLMRDPFEDMRYQRGVVKGGYRPREGAVRRQAVVTTGYRVADVHGPRQGEHSRGLPLRDTKSSTAKNSRDQQGTINSRDQQGTINFRDQQGTINSRDQQGTINSRDQQGTINSQDQQGTINSRDKQGTINSRDQQGTINGRDQQGTINSRDQQGTINSRDQQGAKNSPNLQGARPGCSVPSSYCSRYVIIDKDYLLRSKGMVTPPRTAPVRRSAPPVADTSHGFRSTQVGEIEPRLQKAHKVKARDDDDVTVTSERRGEDSYAESVMSASRRQFHQGNFLRYKYPTQFHQDNYGVKRYYE